MSKRVEVDADALFQVLRALNGPGHYIRELQVIDSIPDTLRDGPSPIGTLTTEYNAWVEQQNAEPKDGCEICGGAKGGVPGNENVINGKVVCDYCHADGSANAPDTAETKLEHWVVAKETVSNIGGTEPMALTYALLPDSPVYTSAELAMSAIKETGLPLGWVAMEMRRLFKDYDV